MADVPLECRTARLESLPKGLRSIAEEIINTKFQDKQPGFTATLYDVGFDFIAEKMKMSMPSADFFRQEFRERGLL